MVTEDERRRRLKGGKYLTALFMLILALFLLKETNHTEILERTTAIPPEGLAIYFALYALYQWFLTLRAASLIHSSRPPLMLLFGITNLHMMSVNLLPARSGELTYIYLLESRLGYAKSEGVATLIAARLMDMMGLLFFLLLSTLFFPGWESLLPVGLSGMTLLAVALVKLETLASLPGRLLQGKEGRISRKAAEKMEAFSQALSAMKTNGNYLRGLFYTGAIWGLKYAFLYGLLHYIGVSPGFWKIVFAGSFMYAAAALPVQSIAGIGAIESGLAGGLILAGAEKETAITAAFGFHLLLLLYTGTLGLVGGMIVNLRRG